MRYENNETYVKESLAELNKQCLRALLNKDWCALKQAELELMGFVIEATIEETDCDPDALRSYLATYHELENMDWKQLHNYAVDYQHEAEIHLYKYL